MKNSKLKAKGVSDDVLFPAIEEDGGDVREEVGTPEAEAAREDAEEEARRVKAPPIPPTPAQREVEEQEPPLASHP